MDQLTTREQQLTTALRRITELEVALATMAGENADLRRQLAKNSGNSGKPPSSDVCAVLAPLGFRLRAEFLARSADVFALVRSQNMLTGDSRMSSL